MKKKNRKLMLLNEKSFFPRPALLITTAVAALLAGLPAPPARATNIAVTNVALTSALYAGRVADVRFDVSWDASWRASWTETGVTPNVTVTNWDAAWIFVKYRCRDGANTNWNHASLSTNDGDHVAPAGSTINVGLSANAGGANFGAGVFLYRSTDNTSGSWTNTGVKLRWRYGDDGVASTSRVDVCVHAIEMVYVAEGAFCVGSGGTTEVNYFHDSTNASTPFWITNENYQIIIGSNSLPGQLYYPTNYGTAAGNAGDQTGILSNAFPKGYSAFYCMKYEISQGQYADFLSQLTNSTQATTRYPNKSDYRHTISGTYAAYTSSAPTRACNYLSWADGAAYADWAGLRPMTELEYEKACRGPLNPVANEYAWGNTTITKITNFFGVDGSGTETALPASANSTYGNSTDVQGPVRCGIFATASSGRPAAGASYWGIMDMSGNLWEQLVTVGKPEGRVLTGVHGDGKLDVNGNADAPTWPGTSAVGTGIRGGEWFAGTTHHTISDRHYAATTDSTRESNSGWRAGRTFPGGN